MVFGKGGSKYICGWCEFKFKKNVNTSGGGQHSTATDQVVCPQCGNFLKS